MFVTIYNFTTLSYLILKTLIWVKTVLNQEAEDL